ncbi:MAG TPA: hypothetical protein VNJ04_08615 [Gemmatimonadaceae bacterium]|nr:hypothetical protein [Gemmatimonadaceae bacterium]
MPTEKKSFEPKAILASPVVEVATLSGKLIRIEEGAAHETTDPVVAADLAAVDALKLAEPEKKETK